MATVPCTYDGRDMVAARVLVVEDHEPFRRLVCSSLGKKPELQIVGEWMRFEKQKNCDRT